MKKKPEDQKCHSKKKSITKKQSMHFTINLHNCNANTMHNQNKQKNKQYAKANVEKSSPIDFNSECHGCKPRRGELVINGGFENMLEPFFGWIINAGVEIIDPCPGDIPHQGCNAVRLGTPFTQGRLYQDVPGICPGLFYQLNFFMSAASPCGNASVNVRMEFLDHAKNLLDGSALEIFIPHDSLNNESFTFFINATHTPAPPDTKFARIYFACNTDEHPDRYVHLDDVSLIAI